MERIEHATGDWDSEGDAVFRLGVVTDEESHEFVVSNVETARSVLSAVNRLRPWIDQQERLRTAEKPSNGLVCNCGMAARSGPDQERLRATYGSRLHAGYCPIGIHDREQAKR